MEQLHLLNGLLRLRPDGGTDVLCGLMPGKTLRPAGMGVAVLVPMMHCGAMSLRRHGGAMSFPLLRGGRRLPLLTMVAGRLSAGASPRARSRATRCPLVLCNLAKDRLLLRALARDVVLSRTKALEPIVLCALLTGALVRLIGIRALWS